MADCAVKGCSTRADTIFEPELAADVPSIQYAVCSFHSTALDSGEAWSEEDASGRPVLLMGEDLPQDVINVIVTETFGSGPTLTLVLGRDGVEEKRVDVRWDPESMRRTLDWLDKIR